jgi:hypothetical protein
MDSRRWPPVALTSFLLLFVGCEKPATPSEAGSQSPANNLTVREQDGRPRENIDAAERAAAAKLAPAKCPVQEEIYAFRLKVRQAYNNRRFDELEFIAAELRKKKEVFGNGSWKIAQYYDSFGCRDDEPASMWKLHDEIHRAWNAAKPASLTAKVAFADFLVEYAWEARGNGFSDTVTSEGWRLFGERLAAARNVLREASALPEKDPYWGMVALGVARGQQWEKSEYDALVEEVTAAEPTYWGYHTERAFSLLPRWYGEPGEWERYAEKAAARPNGLGDELYARIVISVRGYHDNVFRESKASWPRTRDGLQKMREKYPDSLEVLSQCALLAAQAEDRPFAKAMFDKLGSSYLASVWRKPERFTHVKHWAETGVW